MLNTKKDYSINIESTSMNVTPISPVSYPKMRITNCGFYAVKAILSAYNKDTKEKPTDYHTKFLGKTIGFASPETLVEIFKNHGVSTEIKNAEGLSNRQ